jgi:hypothetical protein
MVEFYKGLRSGADKARSLRNAMLSTMKQYPEPSAWAAFILIGEADASPSLKAVHGSPQFIADDTFVFPVPEGVANYSESFDTNPKIYVIDRIEFTTNMSTKSVVEFYRAAFTRMGLSETNNFSDGDLLSMEFHDPKRKRDVDVYGYVYGRGDGLLHVRVSFK